MTTLKFPVTLLATAILLVACGNGVEDKPAAGEIRLNAAFDADFALTDHNENAVSDEDFEGKPMFIYFGFTACPDVCPAALGKMTAALDHLGGKADDVQPLFITVDPKRDTPERLRNHLAYDERILGLTGDPEAVRAAISAMQLYAQEVPLEDSALGYTIDHQSMFFLTNSQGVPIVAIKDTQTPEQIAKLVKRRL